MISRLNIPRKTKENIASNEEYLEMFLHAKRIEGCSGRTLHYYESSVANLLNLIKTPVRKITTEEIREYLSCYQKKNNCGRTIATRAIDKGMPIEQVQKVLGHSQIDTTMQYAMVNQVNVKESHRKYIA